MPDKKSRLGKPRITDNKQVEHPQVTLERAERQASREFRGLVGEQIARNARLGTDDPSKGNEPASETKFQFTSDQRRDVLESLLKKSRGKLGDAYLEEIESRIVPEEIMGRIELIVSLTLENLTYRILLTVPDWAEAKFRDLKGKIEPILSVLNDPVFKFLDEHLPNLKQELRLLQSMVEEDQRPSHRPREGGWDRMDFAIQQLANIWMESGRSVPKDAKPAAPYYKFLANCLEPAGLEISRSTINAATRSLWYNAP